MLQLAFSMQVWITNDWILILMHTRMDKEAMKFKNSRYLYLHFAIQWSRLALFTFMYICLLESYHYVYILSRELNKYCNWNFATINTRFYGFEIFGWCNMLCVLRNSVSTLYATCKCEINISLNYECVTIAKICVTNHLFLCSKLYALPQGDSVTRAKKMWYIHNYCIIW